MMKKAIYFALTIVLFSCNPDKREILLNPKNAQWSQETPSFFQVKFFTSKGEFLLDINRDLAPIGVDRFYNLVRHGYFDNARFHRVVEGFIVQFGIAGNPKVSQIWKNQYIPDDSVRGSNIIGTIAYAFTDPGTRSTQVYINMTDNARLDSIGFAPFGKVSSGMAVVESIYSGYGENSGGGLRRGDQSDLFSNGNDYLDEEFPLLDTIVKAIIIE